MLIRAKWQTAANAATLVALVSIPPLLAQGHPYTGLTIDRIFEVLAYQAIVD